MDKNLESENKSTNTVSKISNKTKELTSIENILITTIRRKRIFLITLISFLVVGYIRTTKEVIYNSIYQGNFTLLTKDPINKKDSSIDAQFAGAAALFDLSNNVDQDIPTLRKLLLSEFILKNLARDFNLTPKNLAERIKIEEDYTAKGVLEIYLESRSPKKDKELLQELSKLYVNYATIQKQKKLSEGLTFLRAQEPAIQTKNIELRNKLENFMKQNNIVNPKTTAQRKKDEIEKLEKLIKKIEKNIKRLEGIRDEVSRGNLNTAKYQEVIRSEEEAGSTFSLTNPEQKIIEQYQNLNTELANALATYTPSSSIVRNINERIKALKPLIQEKQLDAFDRAIESYNKINNLNRLTIVKLKEEFEQLTTVIKEFSVLTFELEAASDTLEGLNSVREKLQFDMAQDTKPWTIIKEPSFKPQRIYPSYRRELITFALFGIFTGVILALLRDKFDDVYHSPREIESEIKAPILGNVPYVEYFADVRESKKSVLEPFLEKSDTQTINSYDRFFYQEALRNIHTSIRFVNSDKPLKVITMTSSIPKEGKSLTNILLAKTLCEMDLKILIIDADLRKPQLHLRLGLNNITGLSNILTDKEIKTSEAIQSVPGFKNWDVITSGTIPPDPTRLLQSNAMNSFIKDLKQNKNYDLVLIDTPPVIGLSDALLVSEKSDGLILIVSTDHVPRNLPKESINKILEGGAYFIGIITNATKKSDELINNYQFGSYNYSYTYNTYMEKDEDTNNAIDESTGLEKIKNILIKNLRTIITKTFNWLDK